MDVAPDNDTEMRLRLERQAVEIALLSGQIEAHEMENEALHRRVEVLENRDTLRLSMAAAVHSFNNHLTSVQCHLHALASGDLRMGPEELEQLQLVMMQAQATARRLVRWTEEENHVALSVNEVIDHVAQLVRPRFIPRLRIVRDLAPDLPNIVAPRFSLVDALVNVALNARDAMERGQLTLRTRREADDVLIEVIDTGRGMDDATRLRIFDDHFTTKTGTGHGIGLTSVKSLFSRIPGGAAVESTPHVGTRFVFRFPVPPAG